MSRVINYRVRIDWDFDGDYTEAYNDVSSYFESADGRLAFSEPTELLASGKGVVDRCKITLRNPGGIFSPLNTSGPLYSSIRDGKAYHAPMYIEVSIDGGTNWSRVFTGVAKIPQETGTTSKQNPLVTIDCRSKDELLLQRRISTTLAQFQAWADGAVNEAQIISAVLAAISASPTAIDAGLVSVPYAWWDDESALEELWKLAAAAGGRFYANADGVYCYENAAHWLDHTSQETLTWPTDYGSLQATYRDSDLYSTVTVEASSRMLGEWDVVWEPDEPVVVTPGATKKITARLQQPIYTTFAPDWQAVSAGGENLNAYVTVGAQYFAQRVEFTIANSNPYWAAYIRKFKLTARPVLGGPDFEESRNSATHGSNGAFFAARGERTRSMRANAFVQSKAQAGMLALFLLHQSEWPRLTYQLRGVPGVPSRRPGDRITINDSSLASSARDAYITTVDWTLDVNGFRQNLTLIDAEQLFPYQSEGYFVVHDTTGNTLLTSGSKPMFY